MSRAHADRGGERDGASGEDSCLARPEDLDKVPQMIWCADEGGKLTFVNRAWVEYTGREVSLALGDGWLDFVHPDDRAAVLDATERARESGVYEAEYRLRDRAGDYRVFRSRARLDGARSAQTKTWYGTLVDISDLRAAELLAENRRIELRDAIHAGGFGTWRVDLARANDYRDAVANQILGLPASDKAFPLGDFIERVHPGDRSSMERHWHALAYGGTPCDVRCRVLSPDGRVRWVRVRARALRDADSEITHATGVIGDITDLVRQERCLELERVVMRLVLAASSAEAVVHELLDTLCAELGADTAEFWIERQGRLTLAASRSRRQRGGEGVGSTDTDLYADARSGVVDRAAAILAPVWRERAVEAGGAGVAGRVRGGCFAFPLFSGRELVGVIGFSASEMPNRGPQLTETLTRIGREIGRLMDRDALEGRRRRINDELRHRVKNLLSVTQAIVSRVAMRAESPREFVETIEGSLRALAISNDLLVEDDEEGASLARLVELIVEPYRPQSDTQVSIGGPPLMLTRRATQSLSLILHELASNGAKYGALVSSRVGEVRITWSVETEREGDPDIHLRWIERFGAPIAIPCAQGSGIEMIRRTTAYELGGKASHRFTTDGLECVLVFPAARHSGVSHGR